MPHLLPNRLLTVQALWIAVILMTLSLAYCENTTSTFESPSSNRTSIDQITTTTVLPTTEAAQVTNTTTSVISVTTTADHTTTASPTTQMTTTTATSPSSSFQTFTSSSTDTSTIMTQTSSVTSPLTLATTTPSTTHSTQSETSSSTTVHSTNASTFYDNTTTIAPYDATSPASADNSTFTTNSNYNTNITYTINSNYTTNSTFTTNSIYTTNSNYTTNSTYNTNSNYTTNSNEDNNTSNGVNNNTTSAWINSTDITSETVTSSVNSWNSTNPSEAGTTIVSGYDTSSSSPGLSLNTSTPPYNSTFEPALVLENARLQGKISDLDDQVQSLTIAVAVIAAILGLFILVVIVIIALKCLRSEPKCPIEDFEKGPNSRTFFRPVSDYDMLDSRSRQSNNVRNSYLRRDDEMIPLEGDTLGTFSPQRVSSPGQKSTRMDEQSYVYDNQGATLDGTDNHHGLTNNGNNGQHDNAGSEPKDKSHGFVDVQMD